jgi:hypothetical protein
VLERAGWSFWRCFYSTFLRRRKDAVEDLVKTLAQRGIEPMGAENAPQSVHTERRVVSPMPSAQPSEQRPEPDCLPRIQIAAAPATVSVPPPPVSPLAAPEPPAQVGVFARAEPRRTDEPQKVVRVTPELAPMSSKRGTGLRLEPYTAWSANGLPDPRRSTSDDVAKGLVAIANAEGPVVGKRIYEVYLRSCGLRLTDDLKSTLNRAMAGPVHRGALVVIDELGGGGYLHSVIRGRSAPPIFLRNRGPRHSDEVPPSEYFAVARYLVLRDAHKEGSDEHLRAVLSAFDLPELTPALRMHLRRILLRSFPYAEELARAAIGK